MSIASKEARQFLLPLRLRCFSSADLEQALSDRGFTLVEYNRLSNDRDVTTLLTSLHLVEYAAQHSAFTYADAALRIVFVQENLSESERQILLSHELGHVCCHHLDTAHPTLTGVFEEQEANEFSGQLMAYNRRCRSLRSVLLTLGVLCCIAFVCAILHWGRLPLHGLPGSDQVCLTHSGECYHRSNCLYVRGRSDILYVTVEEAEDAGYRPCRFCCGDT